MTTGAESHHTNLLEQGYTLIQGVTIDEEAAEALRPFGKIIPQYDGQLRYQVRAQPGFENRRYSKSTNSVLVHTEAPGWAPPPRFLALHCHVQAACGAGQTELADGRALLAAFDDVLARAAQDLEIEWIGHNTGGVGSKGVRAPIVERACDGTEMIRFSYNLLTTGHYDPPVDAAPDPASLPLGALGIQLAEFAEQFFREQKASILIPEDAVLIWDNQRMMHARSEYKDIRRHLTRYWLQHP